MTYYYCSYCNLTYIGNDREWCCPFCGRNGEEIGPSSNDIGDYDLARYNRDEEQDTN